MNGPNQSNTADYIQNILAKINYETGATIWGKQLFYIYDKNAMPISSTVLMNNVAWSLMSLDKISLSAPAVIIKVDIDGNIVEAFKALNYNLSTCMFFVSYINVDTDSSFLIGAITTYLQGEFSVSSDSYKDISLFKYDSLKNPKWVSSIDFSNGFDLGFSCVVSDNIIYTSTTSTLSYYCIFKLNQTDGKFITSKCINSAPYSNNHFFKFKIVIVSSSYVYVYDSNVLFIFDKFTLMLNKVIQSPYLNFYGIQLDDSFHTVQIFGFSSSKLYTFTFNGLYYSLKSRTLLDLTFMYMNNLIVAPAQGKNIGRFYALFNIISSDYSSSIIRYLNAIYLVNENLEGNYCYNFSSYYYFQFNEIWSLLICDSNGQYCDGNSIANMFYKNSTFPSNLVLNITDYIANDITECIYPKYMIDYSSCSYPLPAYNLSNTIILPVGSNIKNTVNYIPFKQCQNSQFYFTVYRSTDNKAPDWTSVSQLNKTLIVDLSKITSVLDSTILILNARMLTCSLNGDYSQAQTQNYTTLFQFTNKNNNFVSCNCTYYIVMNEVSVFTFKFFDNENDQAILTVNETNDRVGFYTQRNSKDTNIVNLLLLPYQISDEPVNIILNYTDIYHQAAEFYTRIRLQLYIFTVFPPVFDSNPTEVHGDMCSNFSYKLPSSADPQGLNYTVSLDLSTPRWVIFANNFIEFYTADSDYDIPKSSIITVILTNQQNAWTKYNLTVDVDKNVKPVFGSIENIIVTFGTITQVFVNVSSSTAIIAVNCTNNQMLSWISFSNNESVISINATNLTLQNTCVKLVSYDSCGKKYESNSFNVKLKTINPPTVTNTLGPLTLFVGDENLSLIPPDMFKSSSNLTYFLSVTNCTTDQYLNSYIQNSAKLDDQHLYVFGDKANSCQLSITALDSSAQTAQAIVEVIIKSCASKDCLKCITEYQSGCNQCKGGLTLTDNGICIADTSFIPNVSDRFTSICGIIVMAVLIAYTLLSFKLGVRAFYCYEFAQTLIIFIFCAPNLNSDLENFASWFQFAKFDFGIFNKFDVMMFIKCSSEPSKMTSIQFYFQTAILNYFSFILFLILYLLIILLLKYFSRNEGCISKIYKALIASTSTQSIAWISIHVVLPFFLINIVFDLANIEQHIIQSLLLITILIMLFFGVILKKPEMLTIKFIIEIDSSNPVCFTLITFVKALAHVCMFTIESKSGHIILAIAELTIYSVIVYNNMPVAPTAAETNTTWKAYSRVVIAVKNGIFAVILLQILINEQFDKIHTDSRPIVALITLFFVCSFCADVLVMRLYIKSKQDQLEIVKKED